MRIRASDLIFFAILASSSLSSGTTRAQGTSEPFSSITRAEITYITGIGTRSESSTTDVQVVMKSHDGILRRVVNGRLFIQEPGRRPIFLDPVARTFFDMNDRQASFFGGKPVDIPERAPTDSPEIGVSRSTELERMSLGSKVINGVNATGYFVRNTSPAFGNRPSTEYACEIWADEDGYTVPTDYKRTSGECPGGC